MKTKIEIEQELQKIEEKEKSLKKQKELLLNELNKNKLTEPELLKIYQQKFNEVDATLKYVKDSYYIEYNNTIISQFSATPCDYLNKTFEKSLTLLTVMYNLKNKFKGTIGINNLYSWGAMNCYLYTNPKEKNNSDLNFLMDINIISDNNFVGNISCMKELYAEEYVVEKTLDYEIIVQSSNEQVSLEILYDWKFNANKDNITEVVVSTLDKLTDKILEHQQQ